MGMVYQKGQTSRVTSLKSKHILHIPGCQEAVVVETGILNGESGRS